MKIQIILSIVILLTSSALLAQTQTQTQIVKGQILDQQSETPLIGATIQLVSETLSLGTSSDIDGFFVLENVPFGRQEFTAEYLGYELVFIPNVEVTAGKEVVLEIKMQESLVQLEEVVIVAAIDKDRSQNEMATVSSRQFSMEEVNRYSGGRSDVARLAGNFAGVSTADDSRNDIVIRGNSPTGVLWKLEGIPIPSPNHFSTIGTTGGPVSALNTNLLKSSDFMTSAFAAEYGNALSGVFDLGFRNGNKDETEVTLQMGGVTGFEGMLEGPLRGTTNGSYIVSGRYSSVGIAQSLGADVGTNSVPYYQDVSFKFDFGKSKFGNFSLFGIGGLSDIEFLREDVDETDLFAADDEDARADSKFGVLGIKNNYLLGDNAYLRTVIAVSGTAVEFSRDRYYNMAEENEFSMPFVIGDNALVRYSASTSVNKKFSAQLTTKTGILTEVYKANLSFKSAELGIDADNDGVFDLIDIYDFTGTAVNVEPYVQTQYKIDRKWTLNGGLHLQYNSLNDDLVIEPRAAINYAVHPKHTLNVGYGLHHQNQPLPIQLSEKTSNNGIPILANKELGFTRSNHFVLSHDFRVNNSWRTKVELYYQYIDNVPVERISSSFSMLNVGADFGFPVDKNDLVNNGTGNNKGVELTIEKFFNQGYYVLFTGSIFDSKYKGSDGVERNTAFNNQRVFNALIGKEITLGRMALTMDTKLTSAGGRFYTPVDLEASLINQIPVLDESQAFQSQYASYFRWDVKLGFKINSKKRKLSHTFYLDIQNITDNQNIFRSTYNRQTNEVNDVYQIGFFPNFMYKVEF